MKTKRNILIFTLLIVLTAMLCACGGKEQTNAVATDAAAEAELGFDLTEALTPFVIETQGWPIAIWNYDYGNVDLDKDFYLLYSAKGYVNYDSASKENEDLWGYLAFDAAELQTYVKEAFGIKLEARDYGDFKFDKEGSRYLFPGSDAGYLNMKLETASVKNNADGTTTVNACYICFADAIEAEDMREAMKTSHSVWGEGVVYGISSCPDITFRMNEGYTYIPVQLVSTKSRSNDFTQAVGTYQIKEDKTDKLTLNITDVEPMDWGMYKVTAVFDDGTKSYEISGNWQHAWNTVFCWDQENMLEVVLSLNDDGSIFVSTVPEIEGMKLNGVYSK